MSTTSNYTARSRKHIGAIAILLNDDGRVAVWTNLQKCREHELLRSGFSASLNSDLEAGAVVSKGRCHFSVRAKARIDQIDQRVP
jgi:hypothetical protein